MARSKKPRKKYNPQNKMNQHAQRVINQCRLYRWESQVSDDYLLEAYGPFSRTKNRRIMHRAINQPNTWLGVTTAYFIDAEDNYYEETLIWGPVGPIVLQDQLLDIKDLITQAAQQAKEAGNATDYQDTCTMLLPYTPGLEDRMDSDDWARQQAARRAQAVWAAREKAAA